MIDMSAEEEVEVMQGMGQTSSHTNALFTKNADAELEGIEVRFKTVIAPPFSSSTSLLTLYILSQLQLSLLSHVHPF